MASCDVHLPVAALFNIVDNNYGLIVYIIIVYYQKNDNEETLQ